MRVLLIAQTAVVGWGNMRDVGWMEHSADFNENNLANYEIDADYLAEFAGRLCYKSWDRPNPKTATNEGYLDNIIRQRHFSVLEHASATFYIGGVSRSLTHELVRHRHLSFSQVSQRYVDESEAEMVIPPALRNANEDRHLEKIMDEARTGYEFIYRSLVARGMSTKQARQAARCVLPNATETEIIVTGNMRAWREVIEKRNSPAADAEMQELASTLLTQLKDVARNTFQDLRVDLS